MVDVTSRQVLEIQTKTNCSIDFIQEENESNKRLASAAQEEAKEWNIKFEAERTLRRVLNAKILDMQVPPGIAHSRTIVRNLTGARWMLHSVIVKSL